jgi:hypothetical protein
MDNYLVSHGMFGANRMKVHTSIKVAFIAAISLASSSTAFAQAQPLQKVVLTNTRNALYVTGSLDPNCNPTGDVIIKIRKPPKNGAVEIVKEVGFINYIPPNIRVKCNEKEINATKLYYTPTESFVGKDKIELETFFTSQGTSTKTLIEIEVKD